MNPAIEQIVNIYKGIPLSRRIAIIFLAVLVMGGFIVLFIWNNQTRYKPAYTELNQEDASEVVAKLKEANIPYEISGGGSIIMVPENQVYDVRLSLAKDGIPK